MKQATLLLRLDDRDGTAFHARAAGASGHWEAIDPGAVRAVARRRACTVLVPAVDVLLTRARLAPMAPQRVRQAVPFALEDELVDDIERLRFTPGDPDGDALPVAVVASARFARWQALLASAGVQPRVVTPDVLGVPWTAGTWSVLLAGELAWVRRGRQSGFATERPALAACLGAALADAAAALPARANLYAAPADADALAVTQALQDAGIAVTAHAADEPADWLGAGLDPRTALNLLDGAPGAAPGAAAARLPWARSAAMLAALSLLQLGVATLEYRGTQRELRALEARVSALWQHSYPGQPVPAEPWVRMERDLAALAQGDAEQRGRLLAVLARTAERLAPVPGWELQRLDFRDQRLDVDLRMADAGGLDRLQQALAGDAALSVQRLSASATPGAADAQFRIRLAAGGAR